MLRTLRALLIGLAAVPAAATADDIDAKRALFREAWQALQSTDAAAAFVLPAGLAGYPLLPYLQAEALRRRLGGEHAPDDADVRRFLARHQGEPVSWRLRRAWWLDLAAREQWAAFLDALPEQPDSDELACLAIRARLRLGRLDGLAERVRRQWLNPADQPAACDDGFDWLRSRGELDAALIGERLLRAIDAGHRRMARHLMRQLPVAARGRYRWAYELRFSPASALKRWVRHPLPQVETARILDAYWRLSRRDPAAALALYEALRRAEPLDGEDIRHINRSLALGLAYEHDPRALHWMDQPMPEEPAYELPQWRVRVALWAQDWPRVQAALKSLPSVQRDEARWQYWAGRAAEQRGRPEAAAAHYAAAAAKREYYGFLAAERLGRPATLGHVALDTDPDVRERVRRQPGIERARELFRVDLVDYARSEWNFATRDWDRKALLAAAREAFDWGWYEQTIVTLAQQGAWDDLLLRFPLPWCDAVRDAAREQSLPAEAVYAVIRSESLYDRRARSGAQAHGLMQLRLPTAAEMARRLGLPRPDAEALFDAPTNIRLGAAYLRELRQRFGAWPLVLAAYNAGPQRIGGWRPPSTMPADIWVETLPYNETRAYLQRVLMAWAVFGWRLHGEPAPIAPLLQAIEP